jgi:2'-5' RNA ligase
MRCFVAVTVGPTITEAVVAELAGLQAEAARCRLKASWSLPESWHATVKFLGDVDCERMQAVAAQLAGVAQASAPFVVAATGLVTLPERARTPKVLAVGLSDDGRFGALARRVDEALAHAGFEPEGRAFRPHLTLARIRSPRGWRAFRPFVDALRTRQLGVGEVNAMTLFSSTLGTGPARYEPLATLKLAATAACETPQAAAGAQAGPRS